LDSVFWFEQVHHLTYNIFEVNDELII
jgi:hypothetical protein